MRVVDGAALRTTVSMEDAIDAVRDAFIGAANGEFQTLPRVVLPSHTLFTMVAERIVDDRSLGQVVKIFSWHQDNPSRSLPVLQGTVIWFDGETGTPQVVIDAAELTALRTGAASGIATELLARRDAKRLAVIGTGATAPDQIRAVCAVRPIESVAVAAQDVTRTNLFVRRMQAELKDVEIRAYVRRRDAVHDADVICTATTAREPLFRLDDIKPNVHINAIGSFTPQMRELGPDIVTAASVCIDDPAAMQGSGELAHVHEVPPTLGELLTGRHAFHPGGITLFKSVGISPQDWAIAARVASS